MNQLFGGLLVGVGILVMACSGLCSLAVIVVSLPAMKTGPSFLLMPLLFGGLPFVTGIGMFRWGQSLLQEAKDREP
ncbi:MAG: hypothetical protein JWN69_382 [Alphaproteobacteria bacterium]|nr:hypothetical protein [Alphaproteobacteria bacterium]